MPPRIHFRRNVATLTAASLHRVGQRSVQPDRGSGSQVAYGANGEVTDSSSGSVFRSDHWTWSPSRNVELKTSSLQPGQTGHVDVIFHTKGDWLTNDVLVDPYRKG